MESPLIAAALALLGDIRAKTESLMLPTGWQDHLFINPKTEEPYTTIMKVWSRWQPWLAMPSLIGVGSVCRRSLKHPTHGLHAILAGLEGNLPEGSKLHMFGVKGSVLNELKMLDWIASADSMAYDFGARIKARKEGRSNTMAHRASEMSQWMHSAAQRLMPSAGDQFRLPLFA